MQIFRKITPTELLTRQFNGAHMAYLEHLAAAETHQTMAEAYKLRMARLQEMLSQPLPSPGVILADPLHILNRRGA